MVLPSDLAEGLFILNGIALNGFQDSEAGPLQATDIKNWLEKNISDNSEKLKGFSVTGSKA
jgi:hypothetical protein